MRPRCGGADACTKSVLNNAYAQLLRAPTLAHLSFTVEQQASHHIFSYTGSCINHNDADVNHKVLLLQAIDVMSGSLVLYRERRANHKTMVI